MGPSLSIQSCFLYVVAFQNYKTLWVKVMSVLGKNNKNMRNCLFLGEFEDQFLDSSTLWGHYKLILKQLFILDIFLRVHFF